MPLYTIRAKYIAVREIKTQVAAGDDPYDPANWGDIESEADIDFYLHDVDDIIDVETEEPEQLELF